MELVVKGIWGVSVKLMNLLPVTGSNISGLQWSPQSDVSPPTTIINWRFEANKKKLKCFGTPSILILLPPFPLPPTASPRWRRRKKNPSGAPRDRRGTRKKINHRFFSFFFSKNVGCYLPRKRRLWQGPDLRTKCPSWPSRPDCCQSRRWGRPVKLQHSPGLPTKVINNYSFF